jgi:inorganic pyrophosphatase
MKALRDPTRLPPFDKKSKLVHVVIETPAGSRNKFAFDAEKKIFVVKKTLPAGMVFPYDFGFVPRTIAEDGDPTDVLLLMDEPAFPGVLVAARLVGVIEGEQTGEGEKIRNDRLVAVADATYRYANIRKLKDLPREWIKQLETFFVNYHELEGKRYELLGTKGASAALRLIKETTRR